MVAADMATTTTTEEAGHDLCERLRAARLEAGLSRAALAGRAECSLASVANLEAGYIPKRSDVLPRILAVLENGGATS